MIKTEQLQRHFKAGDVCVKAVDSLDINIGKGEFVAIMGPSGSGKSTLLYVLGAMDRPTVLIAGGFDKHADFRPMVDEILKSNIEAVMLIGATAQQIADALDKAGFTAYEHCGIDFDAAILRAYELAKDGGSVLLSPACASFDMFSDFEARGREFKRIVKGLEQKRP